MVSVQFILGTFLLVFLEIPDIGAWQDSNETAPSSGVHCICQLKKIRDNAFFSTFSFLEFMDNHGKLTTANFVSIYLLFFLNLFYFILFSRIDPTRGGGVQFESGLPAHCEVWRMENPSCLITLGAYVVVQPQASCSAHQQAAAACRLGQS